MTRETITYKELDDIIDSYKDNRPQKKALLILKSDCEPLRNKDIPKDIAQYLVRNRKETTERMAAWMEQQKNDELALALLEKAEHLGNVIHICYEGNEEE